MVKKAAKKKAVTKESSSPVQKVKKKTVKKKKSPSTKGKPSDESPQEEDSSTKRKTVKKKAPTKKSTKKTPRAKAAETISANETVDVRGTPTEIIYPEVNVLPYFDTKYNPRAKGPLTAEKAKDFLGWIEESEGLPLTNEYLFKDRHKKKVVCTKDVTNRPFNRAACEKYMIEILTRSWKLNGETMIIDRTGMVQDAQHRLVALVWAAQEWEKHPSKWGKYWNTEPTLDTVIVTGVGEDDETINTLNTGRPRTLADVFFRSEYFADIPHRKRQALALTGQGCVRLLWLRTGQKALSTAPKMPHSEALRYVDSHPHILDSVREICELNGSNNSIGGFLPTGMAAGLLYLMSSSKSDTDKYYSKRNDRALNFDRWEIACEFWNEVAKQSDKVEPTLETLLRLPEDVQGGFVRDFRCGTVIKSWNLFLKKKKITVPLISLEEGVNDGGQRIIVETPTCGGIDIGDLENSDELGEDNNDDS